MLPVVIPEICMGVAMLVFFNRWWPGGLPWPLNLGNIIIAHVTFTFSVRRHHCARAAGVAKPGNWNERRWIWGRANGARCAIFYCRN